MAIIWFKDTFYLGRESNYISEVTEGDEDAKVQMSWLLS